MLSKRESAGRTKRQEKSRVKWRSHEAKERVDKGRYELEFLVCNDSQKAEMASQMTTKDSDSLGRSIVKNDLH